MILCRRVGGRVCWPSTYSFPRPIRTPPFSHRPSQESDRRPHSPCYASSTTAQVEISSSVKGIQSVDQLANACAQLSRRLPTDSDDHVYGDQQFNLIISALKLALSLLQQAPARADGRMPAERAVQLASTLADLCAAGLPLDAEAIAAGVIVEVADTAFLDGATLEAKLGRNVATLVHDLLRLHHAPNLVDLYDDEASRYRSMAKRGVPVARQLFDGARWPGDACPHVTHGCPACTDRCCAVCTPGVRPLGETSNPQFLLGARTPNPKPPIPQALLRRNP